MITLTHFLTLVRDQLNRNLDENIAQKDSVSHEGQDILMLVAGPGSGKSTVLILRALRHVLVDNILPEQILITTFTVKAAKELRTRWLDWGTSLINSLSQDESLTQDLSNIDLNRCRINTLDSLAEQTLSENRPPGEITPILLEESTAKLIFKRQAFRDIYDNNRDELNQFFSRYTFDGRPPQNNGKAIEICKQICDRLIQDQVDINSFANEGHSQQLIVEILDRYQQVLFQRNMYDFANLEQRFLERLRNGTLENWNQEITAFLIDEYQDTNPLQEAIYFEIIQRTSASVTLFGDDDQAMYRFRGGSVELFTEFSSRCLNFTGKNSLRIDMIANYRSSEEIVEFYNNHITADPQFLNARILPPKPNVFANRGSVNMPILGLFRQDATILANDLAETISELIQNRRIAFGANGEHELRLQDESDLGDFVLLSHSVGEIDYDGFQGQSKVRFAGNLRNSLANRGLEMFNPRGRAIRAIPTVQRLLGLLLLCLDPDENLSPQTYPTNEAKFFLSNWRLQASQFVNQNPSPNLNGGLGQFVSRWQNVSRGGNDNDFPDDWSVLSLIFKLISWFPDFQNDPEHQVWLEAITRTVSAAAIGSPYGMQIFQHAIHGNLSRMSFIRDALLPIAEDIIQVDEDIMPSVPRNYLQIMTIHQAKGLEFPLVIVDVGSRFTGNHHTQAFMRFPKNPSNVAIMEDDIEPHLPMPLRQGRSPLDRSFDDLVRLYYVAFSRPQSVLLLVGCENCLKYRQIPNIALGWSRDSNWFWRQSYTGKEPIRVEPPLVLI